MANRAVPSHFTNAQKVVPDKALILYDGVCHLCQGTVRFIIRRDPQKRFRFGYIQSPASQAQLRAFPPVAEGLDSVVLIEGGRVYTRSAAALRIARHLSGGWPLLYAFILLPPIIRDGVYDFIARHRYRWFGQSNECSLPSPEHTDRFID